MKIRIISGVVIAVIFVSALLLGGNILAALLLIIALQAAHELCAACRNDKTKKCSIVEAVVLVLTVTYMGFTWLHVTYPELFPHESLPYFIMLFFTGSLLCLLAVYVFRFPYYDISEIMNSYFALIYGPVLISFIYLLREMKYGESLIWLIFICSWGCDTFAYFSGVLFGKHKMSPQLSPKKTIEGAIGGVVSSAVIAVIFSIFLWEPLFPDRFITPIMALTGALGALLSMVGDLAASGIKRNHGIKDYGNCIPGHGGVMDRFDSVIFVGPVIYFLARLFLGL